MKVKNIYVTRRTDAVAAHFTGDGDLNKCPQDRYLRRRSKIP